MINTIIFDFGDIFINLRYHALKDNFLKLGLTEWNEDLQQLNRAFEVGAVTEEAYLEGIARYTKGASVGEVREAWNSMLGDFPLYRLEFLQLLSQRYRLFLLSNTDSIHIAHFEKRVGESFYGDFYQCFEKVYFSFELKMRKPEEEIFSHLLRQHELSPKRTLFVDDKKDNTDAAAKLGIVTWNLQVGTEDVVHLLEKKISGL